MGSLNYPKDSVQVQSLAGSFKTVYKNMGPSGFDLKEYNGLWEACAARPCLGDLDHLLKCMMDVSPGLNVGHNDLDQALGDCFHDVKCTVLEPKKLARKLLVVQKHTRSLKFGQGADKKLLSLKKKMSGDQAQRLEAILACLQPLSTAKPKEEQKSLMPSPSTSRVLKPTVSDCSVDSDGNPTWSFLPVEKQGPPKKTAACEGSEGNGDNLLSLKHTKGIYQKAPLKKPASPKASGKPSTPMKVAMKTKKSPFLSTTEKLKGPWKIHGPFKKTGKSYVTSDGQHVVTVNSKQSANFHKVVDKIYNWILKTKKGVVTREEAKKKRAEILSK